MKSKNGILDQEKIIQGCKSGTREAQRALYDKYSRLMMSICRRYLKNQEDAEDVFLQGMFKILSNIRKFKGEGSFEGWMKRIMVNECLMHIRKNKKLNLVVEWSQVDQKKQVTLPEILHELAYQDLIDLMDDLPTGYRTVFNLYVIEGYKHKEIADLLGISINTSKSQLILAKRRMQEFIKKKELDERAS